MASKLLFLAACVLACSCDRAVPRPARMATPIPAFCAGQVGIEGPVRQQYRITCPAVEEFVSQYGNAGWLAGLADTRLVDDPAADTQSTHQEPSVGDSEDGPLQFRIADLFLWYYLRDHDEDMGIRDFGSRKERDRAIRLIRARLQRPSSPLSQQSRHDNNA